MSLTCGYMVELRGFEPLTPTLPVWCATNCAIAPKCRARLRYTTGHIGLKTGGQNASPLASGPSGRAVVCSHSRGRVSGANTHATAALSRIAPLTTNAAP